MNYYEWIDARIRIDSHTISGTPRFAGTRLSVIMIAKYVERFFSGDMIMLKYGHRTSDINIILVEGIMGLMEDYNITLEDCVYSYEWYCKIMNIDMKGIDIEQLKLYITFS